MVLGDWKKPVQLEMNFVPTLSKPNGQPVNGHPVANRGRNRADSVDGAKQAEWLDKKIFED
jgi:hypothetical protein